MLDIEIRSLKRKIRKTKDILPLIKLMLKDWDKWPLSLYFEIKNRLLNGYVLDDTTYAEIVCCSRSRTLYEARGFYSMSSLHRLLEVGIPDDSIEERICENIEQEFNARYSTNLNQSLSSLASYGSLEALEILEIIAYDNAPAHQVVKLKQGLWTETDCLAPNNQDYTIQFEAISTSLKIKYYSNLLEAIRKIKARNFHPRDMFRPWRTI
jgi:hypothetical protein